MITERPLNFVKYLAAWLYEKYLLCSNFDTNTIVSCIRELNTFTHRALKFVWAGKEYRILE